MLTIAWRRLSCAGVVCTAMCCLRASSITNVRSCVFLWIVQIVAIVCITYYAIIVFFSWTCVYGEIINKLTKKRKLSKKHKLPTYLVIRLWLWKNINETTETLHVKWNKCVWNCITLELLYSAPLFRTYLIFNQFTVPSFLSITCFVKCTYDYSAQRAHSITIRRNNCHKKTIFKRKPGRTTD